MAMQWSSPAGSRRVFYRWVVYRRSENPLWDTSDLERKANVSHAQGSYLRTVLHSDPGDAKPAIALDVADVVVAVRIKTM